MQAAVWLYTPGLIPQNRSFWRQLVPQNRGRKLEASVGAPRALWTPRLAQCQVPLVPGRVRTSPVFPVKWKVVPPREKKPGFWGGQYVGTGGGKPSSGKQSGRPH